MSLSTLRRAAISENPATHVIGLLQIKSGIADTDQGTQDYCDFNGTRTHESIINGQNELLPGNTNAGPRLKVVEMNQAHNAKFKAIIKDALDPIAAEHGMPLTGNQKFGVCNTDGTRPFDCHKFMRALEAAIRTAPNSYVGTITNKMTNLKAEGGKRPKFRTFSIISLVKDYMIIRGTPFTQAEIMAYWIQTLVPEQRELRLMYWNLELAANPEAQAMAFILKMVKEESEANPNVQPTGMEGLVYQVFDPERNLSIVDSSIVQSSLNAYASTVETLMTIKICGSCHALSSKSGNTEHPKVEIRASCKTPGCCGTVVLDPNGACYTHGSGHTNKDCKFAKKAVMRFIPSSQSTDAGGGGSKKALSTQSTNALSLSDPGLPTDLARFDSNSQLNAISHDMIDEYANPGSLVDAAESCTISGISGSVVSSTQVTLKNSSLKAYVLPEGLFMDCPILCEGDWRRQSWTRNEIDGRPYITHPILPSIPLYFINDNVYVSFNALFSGKNGN